MHLPKNLPPNPMRARKPRLGCLGSLVAFFALGTLALLLIYAVFVPWAFFLGGRFHVLAYWQGWGRLHSKTSGDYVLFVRFYPTPGGAHSPGNWVRGVAYLCTPRGEHFQLRLGGGMGKHLKLSTDGEAMHLYMYNRPWFYAFSPADDRPGLDLHGRWQNPNLVMDDGGSISRAFLPDGQAYLGPKRSQPATRETLQVTLTEGSYSEFESACQAPRP